MESKVILLILDGWGNGKAYPGNAIKLANTPNFDRLIASYPNAELKTSGEDVGLPEGQMGNSEVGHMNIGAGRTIFQQLVLINKAFHTGAILDNTVLLNAVVYAKLNNKKIHLMGLVSDGGVHSSIEHLKGLCQFLQQQLFSNFFIHAFTDGRDTDPKGGINYLKELNNVLEITGGEIATVIGRYYAMDRDKRWERVKVAYDAMVLSTGFFTDNIYDTLKQRYEAGETDEFLKPIIQVGKDGKPIAIIGNEDVVICFNFRTDRAREITEALTQQNFSSLHMQKLNLRYVTLTDYDKTFDNVEVVFPNLDLSETLGEVLALSNKKQVRIAETEKYPHVTFFFSGGRELPFNGETRFMAQSPKVATYDLQPEMSADQVCRITLAEIEKNEADFICVNFANVDMVGHTGIVKAEIVAVEKVDECIGKIVSDGLKNNYALLITADHGNGEYMINEEDGSPNTAHTTNLVPVILLQPKFKQKIKNGRLADLAPTILDLMGIPKPKLMTGDSLVC